MRTNSLVLVFLSSLLAVSGVFAQAPGKAPRGPRPKAVERENRRVLLLNALSTLDSVIDELPQVEDLRDRLSIAEGVVNSLAKSRPARCRKMLDSLFDDARRSGETSSSGRKDTPNSDAIVGRIINLAALFDAKLAESYVERYLSEDDSNGTEGHSSTRDASQVASLRLRTALALIDKAPDLSLSLAESSLGIAILPDTLTFLGRLRKKNARVANSFFLEALASVKRRQGYDINELMLLYSYVFSPQRVPIVTRRGLGIFNIPAYLAVTQEYPVEPTLARLYFDVTGQILLDQNRLNPNRLQLLTNGIEGDYYLIGIMLPLAANYAPALAEPLSAHGSVLVALLRPNEREASQASADRWKKIPNSVNLTGGRNVQTVEYLIERAEKDSDPTRKDQLYYQAASVAVSAKEYDRALKIVDKLTGPYGDEAKQFIMFDIALNAASNRQFDKAEFFARRDDDLTRRAFIFTVIAAGMLQGNSADPERATEFLNEVAQLAWKLSNESERVAVLFGLISVYSRFDPALASQILPTAVQAANKLEQFGRDSRIPRPLDIGGFLFDYSMYGDEFTFMDGIKTLGVKDFNGTLSEIRALKGRLPRLKATVAICGAVLSTTS